jgi:hypothetical protein
MMMWRFVIYNIMFFLPFAKISQHLRSTYARKSFCGSVVFRRPFIRCKTLVWQNVKADKSNIDRISNRCILVNKSYYRK